MSRPPHLIILGQEDDLGPSKYIRNVTGSDYGLEKKNESRFDSRLNFNCRATTHLIQKVLGAVSRGGGGFNAAP
jgi:hypothetical protein